MVQKTLTTYSIVLSPPIDSRSCEERDLGFSRSGSDRNRFGRLLAPALPLQFSTRLVPPRLRGRWDAGHKEQVSRSQARTAGESRGVETGTLTDLTRSDLLRSEGSDIVRGRSTICRPWPSFGHSRSRRPASTASKPYTHLWSERRLGLL